MTAPDFAAHAATVFANEPHDMDCQVLMPRYGFSCPCTREARACAKVGRGIAAVRAEDVRHGCYSNVDDGSAYRFACHCGDWQTDSPAWEAEYHAHKDAAAARAFAEASR